MRQSHLEKAGSLWKVNVLCVAVVPGPVHWSPHVNPQLGVVQCIICVVAQVITRMGVVLPLGLRDPLTGRTRDLELLVLELWAGDARQKGSCGVVPWVSGPASNSGWCSAVPLYCVRVTLPQSCHCRGRSCVLPPIAELWSSFQMGP